LHDTKDNVLRELADQMGQLTISMQGMQEDLVDVKQEIKEVRSSKSTVSSSGSKPLDYMLGGGSATNTAEAHQCLPSGAKVPTKMIQQAKSGDYINLADFAPCLEPSLVTETSIVDGELVFKPK
jgi:hypothetical protein